MAKQTFTTGQVLTAAQMTTLQANDYNQTVSAKTASYVLVAADAGTRITMSNAGSTTITVNTGLFTAGDTLIITNIGAGACTVTAGTATVSSAGSLTLNQYDSGTLYFSSASAAIWNGANPGDITGVTAGTGISGGGTSGTVTITNSMATEIAAKGDLIVGTGSATFDNLTVGANGTVLTADSTVSPTGLKWATPASGGGMTSIASGSLSGTSVTLSSISGSYKNLQLVLRNFTFSGTQNNVKITANSITSYTYQYLYSSTVNTVLNGYDIANAQVYLAANSLLQTTTTPTAIINIFDYTDTTAYKLFNSVIQGTRHDNSTQMVAQNTGAINSTAAITSLTIGTNGNNFSTGTYTLYGVS